MKGHCSFFAPLAQHVVDELRLACLLPALEQSAKCSVLQRQNTELSAGRRANLSTVLLWSAARQRSGNPLHAQKQSICTCPKTYASPPLKKCMFCILDKNMHPVPGGSDRCLSYNLMIKMQNMTTNDEGAYNCHICKMCTTHICAFIAYFAYFLHKFCCMACILEYLQPNLVCIVP